MTTMEYQTPTSQPADKPDRKRGQKRMRDLLEHSELGPQLTDEIREQHQSIAEERTESRGMAFRRLDNRHNLLGLLLAALDEFHGIEVE